MSLNRTTRAPTRPNNTSTFGLVASLLLILGLSACGEDSSTSTEDSGTEGFLCADDLSCEQGQFCIDGQCTEAGDECRADGDCQPFERCRAGFCVEREGSCMADTDCASGEICNDFVCTLGCRVDTDCSTGQVCSDALVCVEPPPMCPESCPDHQTCIDPQAGCEPDGTCTTDNDCTGLDVCTGGLCGEAPVPCESSRDCVQGQYCERENNICLPGCRTAGDCRSDELCLDNQCSTDDPPPCEPDDQEPNNSPAEGALLDPNASLEALTLCDDSDWYQFRAFEGDAVSLELDFIHDDGDLNMRLFTPSNDLLQLVGGQNDGEQLSRTVNETGIYTVEVFGAGRGVFTTYALSFERTRNCPEDDSEENDTSDQATPLNPEGPPLTDRFLCETDDDWYIVPLFAGETLDITLDFAAVDGDLTLELYDILGETLLASSDTEGDQEQLTWSADGPEAVLIRIPGAEQVINRYDLTPSLTLPECIADDAEPNDDAMTATPLDGTAEGTICSGDIDWYSINLPADVEVTASLNFAHNTGNLRLELYDPNGERVATEDSDTDNEQMILRPELPGTYTWAISGPGRTQNSYQLTVDSEAPSSCPDDDPLEDNDTFEQATETTPGLQPGLVLCDGDVADWFTFTLAEGQSVEAIAVFDPAQGGVSVDLFGPDATGTADDTPVDTAMGEGPLVRTRAQLGTPEGTYTVRVSVLGDAPEVIYSLRLNVYNGPLPLDCEFDDLFEVNDTPAAATELTASRTLEAIVCGDNVDWYRINVEAGEQISIRADFAQSEGDIDLQLRNGAQSLVARADSMTDNELIQFQAEASEPLFLEVALLNGEPLGNRYDLTVSRIPGAVELSCVTDDVYEQNEDIASARSITAGSYSAIRCAGDDDYYALELESGQTLQATLLYDGDPDDLELALFDNNATQVAEGFTTQQPGLRATWTAQLGGTATIGVTSGQSAGIPYTLLVEVLDDEPSFCGLPDALEPNTSPAEASLLEEPMDLIDLGLCGSDEDWFRVPIPAQMQLVVEASFDPEVGNLDLAAFDTAGQGLAASTSTTGLERLVLSGGEEGRNAVVRAYLTEPSEDTDLRYNLLMSIEEDMGQGRCTADDLEPNNTQGAASAVTPQRYDELSLCSDDLDDWYSLVLNPFQTLTIVVEYEPAEANLLVEAIDPMLGFPLGIPIDERPGRREIQVFSLFGGPNLIHIVNNTPELNVSYTMSLTAQ